MTVTNPMESYAARVASFNATHPATKKRASDPKGKRTLRWPHKHPSPPQLARAGFFYHPTSSSPDNTTCYLCESNLDGWEEDDDAVVEHLKHAPECGWAITVAIEQDVENGSYSLEDPMSERIMNARRMTFGSNWPHENKKGWVCKTKKMVEAGWHYCPTLESEDFVKCSYCQLSLDGWERKDKPLDEHQRRSPDCTFFTLYASIKPNPDRSKKSRASKVSRMSTQSNLTAASDGLSIAETDANPEETMLSAAESSKPSKAARGARKPSKVKRTASKAKGKGSKASEDEQQAATRFLEPEDDDFQVKVVPSPEITLSSRKRKSGEMSATETSHDTTRNDENGMSAEPPPAKRRNTRARASIAQPQETRISAPFSGDVLDTHMSDVEDMQPPPAPASKEKGKGKKKRASSTARKASTASTASKASLRAAVPNDEEIDAALEADLDRPLTDDEAIAEPVQVEQPQGRRLTRSKPGSKKATASVAPARRGTGASLVTVDEPLITDLYPRPESAPAITGENVGSCGNDHPSLRARNLDSKQDVHEDLIRCALISKSREPKSKKVPRQLPTRNTRASNAPNAHDTTGLATDVNSSILGPRTLQDDSGHETDADGLIQSQTKRPSKKASGAKKKVKGGKKAPIAIQNVHDVVQAPPSVFLLDEDIHAPTVDSDHADTVEPDATRILQLQEEAKPAEATNLSKAKGRASNTKAVAQTASVASSPKHSSKRSPELSPELPPEHPPEHSPEHSPSSLPPPSVHMTPRPALSSQSSDAENRPPSSRPSTIRPPLSIQSPSKMQITRIPLAATTPVSSPSKGKLSKLQSTLPWTAIDMERLFNGTPGADKENDPFVMGKATESAQDELTTPEKKLTVEQWIQFNAQRGEEKLRDECERLVGKFESEGVRALRTLEGIICTH